MKHVIEAEDEDLETYFIDNPFIRIWERALQKNINAKTALAAKALDANDKDQDIIIVKENGKFLIKDLEDEQSNKGKNKALKRVRQEAFGYSDEGSDTDEDMAKDPEVWRKKMKELRSGKLKKLGDGVVKSAGDAIKTHSKGDSKLKNKRQKKDEEHIVKYSANAYKSDKTSGDVLKKGKYEPFPYIKLNPKMLNKRYKDKAVKSFEGIVSTGKKDNKRTAGNKQEGLLSGMTFKK
jgi:ribosomal RNA-processing protein 12